MWLPEDRERFALARRLTDEWYAMADVRLTHPVGIFGEPRPSLVAALAAHVHHLAPHAIALLDRDLVLPAAPLARLCYEHALWAQWVGRVPHAYGSVAMELWRQDQVLREESQALGADLPEIRLALSVVSTPESAPAARMRGMRTVLRDFHPASVDAAYLYYRRLSALTHPSLVIAGAYVSGEWRRLGTMTRDPGQPFPEATVRVLAVSLVWAARAFDDLVEGHPRRRALDRAARTAGVKAAIPLREGLRPIRARAARPADRTAPGRARAESQPSNDSAGTGRENG